MGVSAACQSLTVARATFYRQTAGKLQAEATGQNNDTQAGQMRGLSQEERAAVIEVLNSSRFVNLAAREVYATMLDEGRYLCSVSTMYRLLGEHGEVRERRDQLQHPQYKKPELLAMQPNEVWSWDITKLLGAVKWSYFHLYVILDIFSRYVVGWMVAYQESSQLAERLIEASCSKQQIEPGQLTLHADRGSSMKSKPVAMLLADLGVTKTHSRPQVSNDNPYSESQFKTMKYRPEFPERFATIEEARRFCQEFFEWYNQQHHHSGIALLTPEIVHYGQAQEVLAARQKVLLKAYEEHPKRFPRGVPRVAALPEAVWINRPEPGSSSEELLTKFDGQVSQFY